MYIRYDYWSPFHSRSVIILVPTDWHGAANAVELSISPFLPDNTSTLPYWRNKHHLKHYPAQIQKNVQLAVPRMVSPQLLWNNPKSKTYPFLSKQQSMRGWSGINKIWRLLNSFISLFINLTLRYSTSYHSTSGPVPDLSINLHSYILLTGQGWLVHISPSSFHLQHYPF
jgi:hypothetical protein